MIGGGGEKKTLRFVAQYADAWNFVIGSPSPHEEFGLLKARYKDGLEVVRRKLAILEQHCSDGGRSYSDIEKTVVTYIKLAPDAMDTTEVIELCRQLADLGFQHVIFNIPNVHEIEPIEIIGQEVIPQVADII